MRQQFYSESAKGEKVRLSISKLFLAVLALVLAWVVFTQVRMLDGKVIDSAKNAALKHIEYPETAQFEHLQEVKHGEVSYVCGEYRIQPDNEEYGALRPFVVEAREGEDFIFSEAEADVAQYCNLPASR
ncbi:hypothetical protein [Methylobacillus sp.]|uniref:hypothetical protein n=1 Tax=Methylobacillus sp. TaxID=56818 RepID=UPI002FE03DDE